MQAVSLNNLAANAFRILGISGSATQADIDAAARRMRIWKDASRIPASPWDRKALGKVPRSKQDIEQAVMLLHQPSSRIQQRLLWYCGANPPPAIPALGFDIGCSLSGSPLENHNRAVAAMHSAWLTGKRAADADECRAVVESFRRLFSSEEYCRWMSSLEIDGDFEKRSSAAEQAEALRAVSGAIVHAVAEMAQESLDAGQTHTAQQLLAIVEESGPEAGDDNATLGRVLDRAEDEMDTHCRTLDEQLRDKLRTNRQEPEPYYGENHATCLAAETTLDQKIRPCLQRFSALSARNPTRLARGRSLVADLLVLLALGWEWSGQFVRAIAMLEEAEALAEGSPSAVVAIEQQRERCREKLAKQRGRMQNGVFQVSQTPGNLMWSSGMSATDVALAEAAAAARTSRRPAFKKKNYAGAKSLVWILALAIGGVLKALIGSGSSSSRPPTSIVPNIGLGNFPGYQHSEDLNQPLDDLLRETERRQKSMPPPNWNAPTSRPVSDQFGETTREP